MSARGYREVAPDEHPQLGIDVTALVQVNVVCAVASTPDKKASRNSRLATIPPNSCCAGTGGHSITRTNYTMRARCSTKQRKDSLDWYTGTRKLRGVDKASWLHTKRRSGADVDVCQFGELTTVVR